MTVEETKNIIAKYTSGKYAELMYSYSETSGGLICVKDDKFVFADGVRLSIKPKSLFERWDEEAEVIAERGGYWLH